MVSINGTTIDVADTPAIAAVFGRAGTGRGGGSAFPELRIVALGECGTHAIITAAMDSCDVGKVSLAKRMVSALKPGGAGGRPRVTAHPLSAAADTGADLLWRAKTNAVLPVLERLPDGSFRSEPVATGDKRTREHVQGVRVVESTPSPTLADPGATGTRYRRLTTITDPERAPADELAALYAQRWEIESIFDDLGTHQRGPRVVLRHAPPTGSTRRLGVTCACTTPSGP